MVRTYKPKKTSRQAVDEESMQSAIQDVMQGVLSYRKAVDKYNLKLGTLESRVKNTRIAMMLKGQGTVHLTLNQVS
ncbi:unnamed protein product [Parnassius apollo]|uniref:(apollo) hypothetical protein n=1 Tax=Parnassius apollo TaxID=110799 RepID=A0A8S3X7H1_PARAO|nr:unnamed protein product [Parnassius apollo]